MTIQSGLTLKGSDVEKCTNAPVSSAVTVVRMRATRGLNRPSLVETNQPRGGKLTTLDPFHPEGAVTYFYGYPYSFQARFCLLCLQGFS